MTKDRIAKSTIVISLIMILSKILGFMRESSIANSFGATFETDAYNVAILIPYMVFGIIGAAISTTFIPILTESKNKNGRDDMFKFTNNVINILLVFSIILVCIFLIILPPLVNLIAPGFDKKTHLLTIELTQISLLNILFMSMVSSFTAVLQTLDEFIAPSLMGIIYNIPIIIYCLLGAKFGIKGLIIVNVLGYGLQILIQVPWLIKNNYKYKFYINLKDSRIRRMLYLITPIIIGTGVNQLNTIVDKTMASKLPEGSISALGYANLLNTLVYSVFAFAIITVIYPTLSHDGYNSDYNSFKSHIAKAVNNINLIMFPSTVGIIILRTDIINLIFKHGQFDDRAAAMTATALLYYSIGIVFNGLREVINRGFYALQDTLTPMINGVIGVVINIIGNIILVKLMGLGGLALATSISAVVCATLLTINLKRKIGTINGKEIANSTGKIILASFVMGVAVLLIRNALRLQFFEFKGEFIIVLLCAIVGILVYFIMVRILKIKEFEEFYFMLTNKLKNKIRNSNKMN